MDWMGTSKKKGETRNSLRIFVGQLLGQQGMKNSTYYSNTLMGQQLTVCLMEECY
jgi:hypothetical protein